MLPLITAALGLAQQNQQDKEARKQAMADAAMGKIGASAPPSGNKLGAIGNVASAIGGMLGPSTTPSAIGPSGGQPLTAGTSNQLNNALSTLDQTLGTSDEDNDLPIRGNWY